MSEADLSGFKFRFGTHGCYNPLYTSVRVENPVTTTDYVLNQAVYGTPEYTFTRIDEDQVNGNYRAYKQLAADKSASVQFNGPANKKTRSVRIAFTSLKSDFIGKNLVIQYDVSFSANSPHNYSTTKEGNCNLIVGYSNSDGSAHSKVSSATSWSYGKIQQPSQVRHTGTVSIELDSDFTKDNTITSITMQYTSNEAGVFTVSNLKFSIKTGGDTVTVDREVFVNENGDILDGTSGRYVILCPWELKHVTGLTVSVSGQTSTMGIPNKPASRTQIFDTGGPVRTFKITGRRYDFEERVSNWDFINKQFNMACDSEYGSSDNTDDSFAYVGISWLFSNLQVVLKGYTFNIRNSDPRDRRFIHGQNPSSTYANRISSTSDLPSLSSMSDDDKKKLEGVTFYLGTENRFYRCVKNSSGYAYEVWEIKEDTGYNVAITGFNASFSESEPGLLDYTITCVERMEYGDKLYNAYRPTVRNE